MAAGVFRAVAHQVQCEGTVSEPGVYFGVSESLVNFSRLHHCVSLSFTSSRPSSSHARSDQLLPLSHASCVCVSLKRGHAFIPLVSYHALASHSVCTYYLWSNSLLSRSSQTEKSLWHRDCRWNFLSVISTRSCDVF